MTESPTADLLRQLRDRQREAAELHRRYVNPAFVDLIGMAGYGRTFVRAQGTELEDDQGRRYLDFLGGYGTLNLGHNPPQVKAALAALLETDAPGFVQADLALLEGLAAEQLSKALPRGLDRVFFCNSGTEAVEAALKLARAATGRPRLVSCEGAYHGLTLGALGLNGNAKLRDRFGPLLPGTARIPFGDAKALERELAKGEVAAFVVEPIQGEGGIVAPAPGFLREAADLCRRHRALFVLDEVQTGMGRTGKMLACEHAGVTPDAVALAKSLGGGLMPVGAMVCRAEVHARAYGEVSNCQDHANTFGGGPLAMMAVLATLRALEDEGLVVAAAEKGAYLERRLEALASRHGMIREVRGEGLLLGLKLHDATRGWLDRTPLRGLGAQTGGLFAQHVALELIEEHRIVTQTAVNDGSVLKVTPPLTVTTAEMDRFVGALDTVLEGSGTGKAIAHLAGEVIKRRLAGA